MDIRLAPRQSKSTLQIECLRLGDARSGPGLAQEKIPGAGETCPDMPVLLVDERPIAVSDCSAIAAEVWRQLRMEGANG